MKSGSYSSFRAAGAFGPWDPDDSPATNPFEVSDHWYLEMADFLGYFVKGTAQYLLAQRLYPSDTKEATPMDAVEASWGDCPARDLHGGACTLGRGHGGYHRSPSGIFN